MAEQSNVWLILEAIWRQYPKMLKAQTHWVIDKKQFICGYLPCIWIEFNSNHTEKSLIVTVFFTFEVFLNHTLTFACHTTVSGVI